MTTEVGICCVYIDLICIYTEYVGIWDFIFTYRGFEITVFGHTLGNYPPVVGKTWLSFPTDLNLCENGTESSR